MISYSFRWATSHWEIQLYLLIYFLLLEILSAVLQNFYQILQRLWNFMNYAIKASRKVKSEMTLIKSQDCFASPFARSEKKVRELENITKSTTFFFNYSQKNNNFPAR